MDAWGIGPSAPDRGNREVAALLIPSMTASNEAAERAEAALIRECLAGNAEAYAELVNRHRDGIYSFVRHMVGHEADAQDLAQEAFVRAYGAMDRFRPGAPFEPWLYAIAANLCRSHLRRARRRPFSLEVLGESGDPPAPDGDPSAVVEEREERCRLFAAIQALAVDQRLVIVLRHLRGRSYQEIAAILRLPVSTVEHRLRAARKQLRKKLAEEGIR
jgi:RNA polymerase sigma-70 factor (ECF subfamily)